MRVVAIFGTNINYVGACELYRITVPYTVLGKRYQKSAFNWVNMQEFLSNRSRTARIVQDHDIIVFPRMSVNLQRKREFLDFFGHLKRMGKILVYEVDDDFTNEYRDIPGGGEAARLVAANCDFITVSTPYLKTRMENWVNRPAFIYPNSIDLSLWANRKTAPPREMCIRIGLTGSSTHYKDWSVLKDVIPGILKDYPQVVFCLGGYAPDYFDACTEQTERISPLPYDQYSTLIRSCDIVLCPVDPTDEFNRSKSPIKAIEGMVAKRQIEASGKFGGAAVIASDAECYSAQNVELPDFQKTAHDPVSWDRAIRAFLENPRQLRLTQGMTYGRAEKIYNVEKNVKVLADAYAQMLKTWHIE